MKSVAELIENNRLWSNQVTKDNPNFFSGLASQQNPHYLWIGCSDSRVSANTIVGLMPGEVFVHRNVANLVVRGDRNCLSVIQYAVDYLEIEHIIVCGHYDCGGVKAALKGRSRGLIDNWLWHIQDTAGRHSHELSKIKNAQEKIDRLCELNVVEQVINVGMTATVLDAWNAGREVEIHGWIYGVADGLIRDLAISINNASELRKLRLKFQDSNEPVPLITASN